MGLLFTSFEGIKSGGYFVALIEQNLLNWLSAIRNISVDFSSGGHYEVRKTSWIERSENEVLPQQALCNARGWWTRGQECHLATARSIQTLKYGQIRIIPRLFQASSRRHRKFAARYESSTAFPCLVTYICFSRANGFHLVVENVLPVSLIFISSLALGD